MFENTDWVAIIISTITSGVIAFFIAWYFRFKAKSQIEFVYEDNRKSSFFYLFSNLNSFDSYFSSFYEIFERDVTTLEGSNKEIIRVSPILSVSTSLAGTGRDVLVDTRQNFDLVRRFEFTKRNLEPMVESMKGFYKKFSDDYPFYQTYIQDSFLREVIRYYTSTLEYARWVLQGQDYSVYMVTRLNSAYKIIKYLKGTASADKSFPSINEFIKKWKNYELQKDIPPHSSMFKQ